MIDNILETSLLIFCICMLVCWISDKNTVSDRFLGVWGLFFFGSVLSIIVTALIKIWSN